MKQSLNDSVMHGCTYKSIENGFYNSFWLEEIETFSRLGHFKVRRASKAEGHCLYRSRCVDKVKAGGRELPRICVKTCSVQDHGLSTTAQAMRRVSFRLLLSVAVTESYTIHTEDDTKAFVMSKTPLRRLVYVKKPKERDGSCKRWSIVGFKLVFGIPAAPVPGLRHSWTTTSKKWTRSKPDCIHGLYFVRKKTAQGVAGVQVDDTICARTAESVDKNNSQIRFSVKWKG